MYVNFPFLNLTVTDLSGEMTNFDEPTPPDQKDSAPALHYLAEATDLNFNDVPWLDHSEASDSVVASNRASVSELNGPKT